MHKLSKIFLVVGSALVLAALTFGFLVYVNAGDPTDTDPVHFDGTWSAQVNASTFVATIANDTIEIQWQNNDSSGLYWKGSFPRPLNASKGGSFDVLSIGDTAAMQESLLGSGDTTKTFTYENRTLNFQMTVLGVTQTVHLEKKDLGV